LSILKWEAAVRKGNLLGASPLQIERGEEMMNKVS